jgi:competence protein ComEC
MVLLQDARGVTVLLDGGNDARAAQALVGAHLPFWQRDISAVLVSAADPQHVGGLRGLTTIYNVHLAIDAGAIYPSATYAQWRAELRTAAVPRVATRTNLRLVLDPASLIDVLQPRSLSLDEDPAPVAYRIRIGHRVVLVLNQAAASSDSPLLKADGACVDDLVVTGVLDPSTASFLLQDVRPRLTVLPAGTVGGRKAVARPLPGGSAVRTLAPGEALQLSTRGGTC